MVFKVTFWKFVIFLVDTMIKEFYQWCGNWLSQGLIPALHAVTSYWLLEIRHGGSIYTVEINKLYKIWTFFPFKRHILHNTGFSSCLMGRIKEWLISSFLRRVPHEKLLSSFYNYLGLDPSPFTIIGKFNFCMVLKQWFFQECNYHLNW